MTPSDAQSLSGAPKLCASNADTCESSSAHSPSGKTVSPPLSGTVEIKKKRGREGGGGGVFRCVRYKESEEGGGRGE